MAPGKVEDKKHVLAKIRTEMTDTIVKDSSELVGDLLLINASIRTVFEKKMETDIQVVNRKIPLLIEKHHLLTEEVIKRQKRFQDLCQQNSDMRETSKTKHNELSALRGMFRKLQNALSESNRKVDQIDKKIHDAPLKESSRSIDILSDLSEELTKKLKISLDYHQEGLKMTMKNGKSYIITPSKVLDAETMEPLDFDIHKASNYPEQFLSLSGYEALACVLKNDY